MTAAVKISNLHKTYVSGMVRRKKVYALQGVDLCVERGAVFGLIGLNGAGKTTMIKSILSIVHPDNGNIEVLGGDPTDPVIRKKIGYLPERLALPAFYTPLAFLTGIGYLKTVYNPRQEAKRLINRVGLDSAAERKIGNFSKGMKQRLGLAAALIGAPELLILDEPADGIDPIGRMLVRQILLEERERGCTVFLNSHLLSEVERVCDWVGIISKGIVARSGKLEELADSQKAKWKVRFSAVQDAAVLSSLGFFASKDLTEWYFDGEVAALNQHLVCLVQSGLQVTYVNRETSELEEIFQQAVTDHA